MRINARNFELQRNARPLQHTDRTDYTAPLSLARSVKIRRNLSTATAAGLKLTPTSIMRRLQLRFDLRLSIRPLYLQPFENVNDRRHTR